MACKKQQYELLDLVANHTFSNQHFLIIQILFYALILQCFATDTN